MLCYVMLCIVPMLINGRSLLLFSLQKLLTVAHFVLILSLKLYKKVSGLKLCYCIIFLYGVH